MIQDDDVPVPVPGPGEVLVKVAGTSFNPSDLGVRRGLLPTDLPYTLCGDVAGTVVAIGPAAKDGSTTAIGSPAGSAAATGFAAGSTAVTDSAAVIGAAVIGRVVGAGADYVVVPRGDLVLAPGRVPLAHAAAVPIAGLTAWQAVFEHAKVVSGMRILINGAGGGVGGFAVQLAKHAGAHVTATASPRSAATVRAQGADEIVDYTRTPLPTRGFDAILNLVHLGPADARKLASVFGAGGAGGAGGAARVGGARGVNAGGVASVASADVVGDVGGADGAGVGGAGGVTAGGVGGAARSGGVLVSITVPIGVHFVARNDTRQLSELVALIDSGVIAVDVAGSRGLGELPDVHREAEAGLLRGKTVLLPGG